MADRNQLTDCIAASLRTRVQFDEDRVGVTPD
jgi:hypothetical protein